MERLMTGQPLRTAGALTIVGLAHEADVKRHVLTHRHTDLKDEFYARARGQNHVSPQAAIAHQEMDALRRRLTAALEENQRLRDQIHALARQLNLVVAEHHANEATRNHRSTIGSAVGTAFLGRDL